MEKLNNKVLWASRHSLTDDQLNGLEKIAGKVDIKTVNKTFKSAEEIAEAAADCDYLAVVLPVGLLSELYGLLKPGQTILVPRSKRIMIPSEDGTENKVVFAYDGWEVIEKVVYVSHVVK